MPVINRKCMKKKRKGESGHLGRGGGGEEDVKRKQRCTREGKRGCGKVLWEWRFA